MDHHPFKFGKLAEGVLRYLLHTADLGLTYSAAPAVTRVHDVPPVNTLVAYVDATTGQHSSQSAGVLCDSDDCEHGRPRVGYCITLNGAAVSTASFTPHYNVDSSMAAEYCSMFYAAQELVSLRTLPGELGFPQTTASVLYEDNDQCARLARGEIIHNKSKAVDVKSHWTRRQVMAGVLGVKRVKSDDNPADLATKNLPRPALELHRRVYLGAPPVSA
jgi:hypothetical protein